MKNAEWFLGLTEEEKVKIEVKSCDKGCFYNFDTCYENCVEGHLLWSQQEYTPQTTELTIEQIEEKLLIEKGTLRIKDNDIKITSISDLKNGDEVITLGGWSGEVLGNAYECKGQMYPYFLDEECFTEVKSWAFKEIIRNGKTIWKREGV